MDFRQRLQRPRGINEPGHAHELTFSCYRRFPFLSTDRSCTWLADAVRKACEKWNYSLWAYVFMPEHVHLIVFPRQREYDTGKFLKSIKEPFSRRGVAHLKKHAPQWLERIRVQRGEKVEHHLWQPGRGYDRNIERSQTLMNMVEYVHQNPVRRALVEQAADWKWSSASWFAGQPLNDLRPDPIPWDWLEDLQP